MVNIPLFTRFYTSQVVVWDFFHQPYCVTKFSPIQIDEFSEIAYGPMMVKRHDMAGWVGIYVLTVCLEDASYNYKIHISYSN